MYDSIEALSSFLGIGSGIMSTAIALVAAMGITVFTYTATRSMVVASLSSMVVLGGCAFMGMVPLWMVVMQAVFAVGYLFIHSELGFGIGAETEVEAKSQVADSLLAQSQGWREYHNNLDELLGMKTIAVDYKNRVGLELYENELRIDTNYDWFIVDKHSEKNIFKVVGLHKVNHREQVAYLLGEEGGKLFLSAVDKPFLGQSIDTILCKEYTGASSINDAVAVVASATIIAGVLKSMAGEK